MLLYTLLAAAAPAACAFLVISLIPPKILGRMGRALSLIATGLLLTLALTHLLPEAIEQGSDIHVIGMVIWGTIMFLVALEMFFNSGHKEATCPVCAARLHHPVGRGSEPITINAISRPVSPLHSIKLAAATGTDVRAAAVGAAAPAAAEGADAGAACLDKVVQRLVPVETFNSWHQEHCTDPDCSCHYPGTEVQDSHEVDNRSALKHMGHTHHFALKGSEIERARHQAEKGGSIRKGLTTGGAPVLTGSVFHSLCDGIVIASSFYIDINVGVAVTAAILMHELPQQLSNYVLMLNFGMSRVQGYIVNAVALIGSLSGSLLFYNILDKASGVLPYALAMAGGSFIYVALSDILPRLNRPDNRKMMLCRLGFLLTGALLAIMLSHHH